MPWWGILASVVGGVFLVAYVAGIIALTVWRDFFFREWRS